MFYNLLKFFILFLSGAGSIPDVAIEIFTEIIVLVAL
jgi:hypothetical protein